MVTVAVDIGHPAIRQMHVDAATAGAHVAGCLTHLVGNRGRGLDLRLGHVPASLSAVASIAIWRSSSAGITWTGLPLATNSSPARIFVRISASFSPMPPVKTMASSPPSRQSCCLRAAAPNRRNARAQRPLRAPWPPATPACRWCRPGPEGRSRGSGCGPRRPPRAGQPGPAPPPDQAPRAGAHGQPVQRGIAHRRGHRLPV